MRPSEKHAEDLEIHRAVFGAHQELREKLDGIEASLVELAAGSRQAFAEARAKFEALLLVFVRHLEREEAVLGPVLETLEPWGPARLEQLQLQHTAQRIQLAELASLDVEPNATVWSSRMKQFSTMLRAEMDGEEKDFLPPAVMRSRGKR